MNKQPIILWIAFCLILASCQKNEEQLTINQDVNTLTESTISKEQPTDDDVLESASTRLGEPTELMEFERRMAWTSFITGKLLRYDDAAKAELLTHLSGSENRIPIADLLTGTADPSTPFETGFVNELSFYIYVYIGGGRPSYELDPPPQPIAGYPAEVQAEIDDFMDFIVRQNCLELYFPRGLVFPEGYTLTTTAHPLTSSESNEGVLRHHQPIMVDGALILTELVEVNDMYVDRTDNVIVVRPVRPEALGLNNECLYPEYFEINFLDFLDY